MTSSLKPNELTHRLIEKLGGPEKFRQVVDDEFGEMERRWEQNVDAIGRILRSHLYVEHYLVKYLEGTNPQLGSITNAKLSFMQKVELVGTGSDRLNIVLPGIRHINKVRNRLAHNLSVAVTKEDAAVFLKIESVGILIEAKHGLACEPLVVLEEFAQYASVLLRQAVGIFDAALRQALEEDLASSLKIPEK